MTNTQKIIKYFALALALSIIINILYGITFGLSSVTNLFNKGNEEIETKELNKVDFNNKDINSLEIDLVATKLIIKTTDELKIETNNKYLTTNVRNNKLYVKEKKHALNMINENIDLIVYLPKNYSFDEVDISTGAGIIEIDTLNTKNLSLELGAGKTSINNINVTKKADIEGGAGEIDIQNANINNLDLEGGVGSLNISGILTGNNNLECGVGKLTLNLEDDLDNYKIKINKGIGNASINNNQVKDDTIYGTGTNLIDLEGGVGNIQIITK